MISDWVTYELPLKGGLGPKRHLIRLEDSSCKAEAERQRCLRLHVQAMFFFNIILTILSPNTWHVAVGFDDGSPGTGSAFYPTLYEDGC